MSNNADMSPELLENIALLNEAGIANQKWRNSTQRMPLMIFHSRVADHEANRQENDNLRMTTKFINAPDQQTKELLLQQSKNMVYTERTRAGDTWRCLAKKIGHKEDANGSYWFEGSAKGKKKQGDCCLCGLDGHDLPDCSNFREQYLIKNNRPFVPGRRVPVPSTSQAPLNDRHSLNDNGSNSESDDEDAVMSDQGTSSKCPEQTFVSAHLETDLPVTRFAFEGQVRGYAELNPDTKVWRMKCRIVSGSFANPSAGEHPLSGATFSTENGFFLSPADMQYGLRKDGETWESFFEDI